MIDRFTAEGEAIISLNARVTMLEYEMGMLIEVIKVLTANIQPRKT